MHEASLVRDLVRRVAVAAGDVPVVGVTVRRGGLCHVSAESLEHHFASEVPGTVLEAAALKIIEGPGGDEALADPHAQDLMLVSIDVAG